MDKNSGFTLLEILISLFLLFSVLLGFDAVLLTSLQQTNHAYQMTVATHQVISLVEKIHTWKDKTELEEQIDLWNEQNHQLLPLGAGHVSGTYPDYFISLHWGPAPHYCDSVDFNHHNCLTMEVHEE